MDAYLGVVYYHFYCISNAPSPSADIKKGRMFISQVWPYDEAANNTEDIRCAVSILLFCLQLGLPTGAFKNLFKISIH